MKTYILHFSIKYLTILLIISILAIGVFGFGSMTHGGGHGDGCVASSALNSQCPVGIMPMYAHHIEAYISFFSVVPSVPFALFALLALLLCANIFLSKLRTHKATPSHFQALWSEAESIPILRKIIRWLSLLELSPPHTTHY